MSLLSKHLQAPDRVSRLPSFVVVRFDALQHEGSIHLMFWFQRCHTIDTILLSRLTLTHLSLTSTKNYFPSVAEHLYTPLHLCGFDSFFFSTSLQFLFYTASVRAIALVRLSGPCSFMVLEFANQYSWSIGRNFDSPL